MPKKHVSAASNALLARIPPNEFRRIASHLEPVTLGAGQVLFNRGMINHVYFPISGVISKTIRMDDRSSVEAGMVGKEGMVPLCLLMGLDASPFEVVVQNRGEAVRMEAATFNAIVRPGQMFHSVLLRFAAAFMAQVSQAAGCNQLHRLQKRYCRWLLMTHDRLEADEFILRQETAAALLGVRRMSVTPVAQKLQRAGLIKYSRGQIEILDRPGLEATSCECYRRIKDIYDTLLVRPFIS